MTDFVDKADAWDAATAVPRKAQGELDRFRAALQRIADAGPMFAPDDWRWQVARDALAGHVSETPKPEHDREDVLTDGPEITGVPV